MLNTIAILHKKVQQLVKKHQTLSEENQSLKAIIAQQEKDLIRLNKQFESIEQGIVLEQMGKKLLDADDKKKMKKQINQVIGTIDKLLVSLND